MAPHHPWNGSCNLPSRVSSHKSLNFHHSLVYSCTLALLVSQISHVLSILYILVYSLCPHPIYPLLIICPHFLSVSIEIPPKDSPRTICWFIQSVRTEIGKTQISILPKISCIRSDLSSVYVLCIYHMIPWLVLWYKFMCVYVCAYIYISLFSSQPLFLVLKGRDFCATISFSEHMTACS